MFMKFFPLHLWEEICAMTVEHSRRKGELSFELNVCELMKFHALLLGMSLCVLPAREMYWSTNPLSELLPKRLFNDVMSFKKFKEISRFLHFSSNDENAPKRGQPGYDRIFKIRHVVEVFQRTFMESFRPGLHLAVDEGGFPYKGSRSPIKTYNPKKPNRWFMMIYCLNDSETKYCWRFFPYVGKDQEYEHKDGLGHFVLMHLTEPLHKQSPDFTAGRIIYADRYFNSIKTGYDLLKKGIYLVGTMNPLRKGWNAVKDLICFQRGEGKERGEMKVAVTDTDEGPIYAACWLDNGVTYSLSTAYDGRPDTVRRKLSDGIVNDIPAPSFLKHYQTAMRGVDTHDQLRLSGYSLLKSLVFKVWYKVFYIGIVDMALTNAYILYNHLHPEEPISHLQFFTSVQDGLLHPETFVPSGVGTRGANRRPSLSDEATERRRRAHHEIQRTERPRECVVCRNQGKRKRTSFECSFCDVGLCVDPCFGEFHNSGNPYKFRKRKSGRITS
jgi:hypothetical protein